VTDRKVIFLIIISKSLWCHRDFLFCSEWFFSIYYIQIAPYITRIVLRSEFFIAGAFAKRRAGNFPSEFHCYVHARGMCERIRVSYGIDFFSFPRKALPDESRHYFTLDGFVSKTTGRNALGKNREESRKIARRVRHAIFRNENYIDVLVARNQNHVSSTKIWPKITGTAVRNL